jgi:hypothetical protein
VDQDRRVPRRAGRVRAVRWNVNGGSYLGPGNRAHARGAQRVACCDCEFALRAVLSSEVGRATATGLEAATRRLG